MEAGRLEQDYNKCYEAMGHLRDASGLLIDVFEEFLMRLRPSGEDGETYTATMQLSELGSARRAINEARRHLR